MPSGPKKRRAVKRKEERASRLAYSRDGTISQEDVIDNTSFNNHANLGDHPVVATSNTIDPASEEVKSVKDFINATPDEVGLNDQNQDEPNVLPIVETKTTDLPDLLSLDLKDKEGICAIMHDINSFAFIPEGNAYYEVIPEENELLFEGITEPFLEGVTLENEPLFNGIPEENVPFYEGIPLSTPKSMVPEDDKESPPVESGVAILSPMSPDHQARNISEANIWQLDGELLATNSTKSISAMVQNPLDGILPPEEIAFEEEHVGKEVKILNVKEQFNFLKNAVEEVQIATNKLRELLLKVLDDLDAIEL
ncbi:hypothetical protein ACH5RR_039693 [Cinchona calisaya]|uniref:Uncharacterized protein n=1 Tax=Cinchona calisaya TaxID=153742 RepID=A0ABD2Y1M0_9GENT